MNHPANTSIERRKTGRRDPVPGKCSDHQLACVFLCDVADRVFRRLNHRILQLDRESTACLNAGGCLFDNVRRLYRSCRSSDTHEVLWISSKVMDQEWSGPGAPPGHIGFSLLRRHRASFVMGMNVPDPTGAGQLAVYNLHCNNFLTRTDFRARYHLCPCLCLSLLQ